MLEWFLIIDYYPVDYWLFVSSIEKKKKKVCFENEKKKSEMKLQLL